MSKKHILSYVGMVVLVSLLAAGVALALKGDPSTSSVSHPVSLNGGIASPQELIIPLGDTIAFSATDGLSHTISSGKGNDYGEEHDHADITSLEGYFEPGEMYVVTISDPGTYYFHDHINPDAFITVLVYTDDTPL